MRVNDKRTVPGQIRSLLLQKLKERNLTVNDWLSSEWPTGVRKIIQEIHMVSPVLYNPGSIGNAAGRREAYISRVLGEKLREV